MARLSATQAPVGRPNRHHRPSPVTSSTQPFLKHRVQLHPSSCNSDSQYTRHAAKHLEAKEQIYTTSDKQGLIQATQDNQGQTQTTQKQGQAKTTRDKQGQTQTTQEKQRQKQTTQHKQEPANKVYRNKLSPIYLTFDEYYRGKHPKLRACSSNDETGARCHSALHQTRSCNFSQPTAENTRSTDTQASPVDVNHPPAVANNSKTPSTDSSDIYEQGTARQLENVTSAARVVYEDSSSTSSGSTSSSEWPFVSSEESVKYNDCTRTSHAARDVNNDTVNNAPNSSSSGDTSQQHQCIHKPCTDDDTADQTSDNMEQTALLNDDTAAGIQTAQPASLRPLADVASTLGTQYNAHHDGSHEDALPEHETSASEQSMLLRPDFEGMKPTFV